MIDECTFCGHYGYLKRIDGRYLCKQCSRTHFAGRQRRLGDHRALTNGFEPRYARR